MIRQSVSGHGDLVILGFWVFPSISFGQCFFFGEGEVFLGDGFIVAKGREGRGEKFAVFFVIGHLDFDLRDKQFVFIARILFV